MTFANPADFWPAPAAWLRLRSGTLARTVGALAVALLLAALLTLVHAPTEQHVALSAAPTASPPVAAPADRLHDAAPAIDFAKVFEEEERLLQRRISAKAGGATQGWYPTGGLQLLTATSFPSASQHSLSPSSEVASQDAAETPAASTAQTADAVPLPPKAPAVRWTSVRTQPAAAAPVTTRPEEPAAAPPAVASNPFSFLRRLFAPADSSASALLAANPQTAVYDIADRVVYLPNGEKLEAHSGLGHLLDDPSSKDQKSRGVTPPNVYAISLRERLFHGVKALRLTPVGDGQMFGRDGILAHTYMLGPNGQSNGCVSIKDYPRFLQAFEHGEIKRLIVVPNMHTEPARIANAAPGRA